jgi:hypothetical protein
MQFLKFETFIGEHKRFLDRDIKFENTAALRNLWGKWDGGIFRIPRMQLTEARMVELPVETVRCIQTLMRCLRKLIELAGEGEGEMRRAMTFVLGQGDVKNLFSFAKYLQFFLLDFGVLDEGQLKDLREFVDVIIWIAFQLTDATKPQLRRSRSYDVKLRDDN